MSHDRHDRHIDPGATTHEPPLAALLGAWAALMLLLALTVGASFLNLGQGPGRDLGLASVAISMGIAVAKTLIILLIFMHLAWRNTVTRLFAAASFVWLAILFALTLSDFLAR